MASPPSQLIGSLIKTRPHPSLTSGQAARYAHTQSSSSALLGLQDTMISPKKIVT